MDLTGGLSALAQLEPNASVELSGDQTVGYNHHHSRDEEQSEQQQHIPEKQPEWKERQKRERERERAKVISTSELNQPSKPTKQIRFSSCWLPELLAISANFLSSCTFVHVLELCWRPCRWLTPPSSPLLAPWCLAKGTAATRASSAASRCRLSGTSSPCGLTLLCTCCVLWTGSLFGAFC